MMRVMWLVSLVVNLCFARSALVQALALYDTICQLKAKGCKVSGLA